jgi:predicted MPP superfamily phosphohydrolase
MIAGFELGCRGPLLVRRERVAAGARGARTGRPWRLFYASDLHFTARRRSLAAHLVAAAEDERPDAVLLGGDLIDRRTGLELLAATVRQLTTLAPVLAVPGNHDAWLGLAAVRAAVRAAGGQWLPDADAALHRPGNAPLHLHARVERREAGEAARVLVAHSPEVITAAAAAGYDLVLAGHLHGGQCVLWRRGPRLYPGAWFSRWTGLRFTVGGTTLLVSRGAADTLPVRFRCPREVLSCTLGVAANVPARSPSPRSLVGNGRPPAGRRV